MSIAGPAKFARIVAISMVVVAVPGFIITMALNAFFLDDYDAYGEVPVPGSASVHLPRGEVDISLHTVVVGSPNGGLPVPPMDLTIAAPSGVANPVVTENIGGTTTVNNDAHVRVWVAHVPADGMYNITTDGKVNGFIDPRLAFGHSSRLGFLVWVFVGVFVAGLVGLIVISKWFGRGRRAEPSDSGFQIGPVITPTVTSAPREPGGEGVRLERLKTIAALRSSGALTEAEFEAEKRRILEGR